ncbi:enhancer of mRNA-decapping protein 4 [Microplitis mediator]|uniref:enhancer of mRNA-decapping protein 4 n=1 Tax=Microplitis mediator TaxID=375433 RepID=UPI002555DBCB|nr:enhancer of mRNA-decapping protein 4 [Microplitis mediator]XP_057331360.1 enhancer of mRNA-decapping protein 4 [Microplitis mediator]
MFKVEEDGLRSHKQSVEFSSQEDHHSADIYSTDVTVVLSPGGHDHGSSKVKLKNIVDFTWELQFYTGQLLAVHMSGKYLAYGIKAGSGAGVVRVVYKDSEQRALLRGMRGAIQDLAFAHVQNAILACIDHTGSFFVHTIVSTAAQLVCNLLLLVNSEDTSPTSHRVIWCPFIPDDDSGDADDVSKLLMVTRGPSAELWSIDNVYAQLGSGPLALSDPAVKGCGGFAEICQHEADIVEAILSPDGTAIATASLDGEVKFFQVVYNNTLQQACCLHQWKPHDGRPVSSLFFLDDHKNYNSEAQFWRFAITGCENNTELKVWSCEKWKCLQTIRFQPSPSGGKMPKLKAGLDLSAGFLLLSDISNKGLYILSIAKDTGDGVACISTISEFRLPYPILSFGIVDAGMRKVRPTGESLEDLCPLEDESDEQLVIRMYLVQPKSLQECHIAFQPARQLSSACMMDTLTHDSLDYSEDLQHIRHEQNGVVEENGDETVSGSLEANHTSLNLMTPDAFSSPAKKENNLSGSTSPELGNVLSASPSLAQAVHALNTSDVPLATSDMERAPQSGGSSPSREVREILSLAEPDDDEEEEDFKDIESVNKDEENWSNIPMVMLKDVHLESDDISKDEKVPKDSKLVSQEAWLATSKAVTSLSTKLDGILEIIQDQRQELREMRVEVSRLRQDTPVLARVENAFTRVSQQQLATIEKSVYGRLARQNEFLTTVETTVKENIQSTLPRVVNEVIEPMKNQFKCDVERIDDLMRDNLTQLVGSNQMRDIVVNAAKSALDEAFKKSFESGLLPGFEKACQTMFRQIQESFAIGTKEYLEKTGAILERVHQKKNEQQSEALSRLVREQLETEISRGLNTLQEGILRSVRDSIRENMGQHMMDIQARSRATTPGITASSPADAQMRVLAYLRKGQLTHAFQYALSASDLGLVVLVCDKVEPSQVFAATLTGSNQTGTGSILPQPVILSLVQQLAADLGHRTELKHKWLEEAIWNLDPNDPVTREHMGAVLMTLQTQLTAFMNGNPLHRLIRRMKMLSMAAQALLNQQHP